MSGDERIRRIKTLVRSGDTAAVKQLLEEDPTLINAKTGLGGWLHFGLKSQEMTRMLLALGCDTEVAYQLGPHSVTPAMTAISDDNPDALKLLLGGGARLPPNRELLTAVVGNKRHSLELVQVLQQHGADLHEVFTNEIDGSKCNVLSYAMAYERGELVAYLKTCGCVLPNESPPDQGSTADGLLASMAEEFGAPNPRSLTDILGSSPSIVVHAAGPSDQCHCVTLFTTGMSDLAMSVPAGEERFAHAELFIQLPISWPYLSLDDNRDGWPALWLRELAAYPHRQGSWLGGAAAIIRADVLGIPIGGRFSAMLLLCEKEFLGIAGCRVVGYRLFPLHENEVAFERSAGIGELLKLFDDRSVGFVVNMDRDPVVS